MKKILLQTLVTFFMCFVYSSFALAQDGSDSTIFTAVLGKSAEVLTSARNISFVIAGFGLIAFAWAAIFGKISWKHFFNIGIGLFLLAVMGGFISFMVTKDGNSSSLSYGSHINDYYTDTITTAGSIPTPPVPNGTTGDTTGEETYTDKDGNRVTQTTNEDGSVTTTTSYNNGGQKTETTNPTDGSSTTREVLSDGTIISTNEDENGNTNITTEHPDGSITTKDILADGTSTTTTRDKFGDVTEVVEGQSVGGGLTSTQTTTYEDGDIKSESDGFTYAPDAVGDPTAGQSQEQGDITTQEAADGTIKTTEKFDDGSKVVTITSPNGSTTTTATRPDGSTLTTVRDKNGNVVSTNAQLSDEYKEQAAMQEEINKIEDEIAKELESQELVVEDANQALDELLEQEDAYAADACGSQQRAYDTASAKSCSSPQEMANSGLSTLNSAKQTLANAYQAADNIITNKRAEIANYNAQISQLDLSNTDSSEGRTLTDNDFANAKATIESIEALIATANAEIQKQEDAKEAADKVYEKAVDAYEDSYDQNCDKINDEKKSTQQALDKCISDYEKAYKKAN